MNKKSLLLAALTVGVYLSTRLINLTLIPMFTDEAIYLRWSQIISGDLHYLYLPLTDGKPPLFMWLVATAMKVASLADPLFVGRLTAVLLGILGVVGIYFTANQLFKNRQVSLISVLFYLVSPFTFFYDRFSVADGLLSAIGTWSLGLGVVLVKSLSLKIAIILGIVIGLGLWTKSPAIEFFLLLPSLLLLLNFKEKDWRIKTVKYIALLLVVFVVSRAIYSIILLLPQAYVINLKNLEFAVSPAQFLKNPFEFFVGNLHALSLWTITYLTWPMVILVLVSLVVGIFQRSMSKLILLGYFASHFFFMVFFNKTIYPRFLLMFFPLLLILAAKGIQDLKKFAVPTIILVTVLPLFVDWKILTDPINAPIADADSRQYLNSWSAGFGLNETRDFLHIESQKNKKVVVGVEGTFGLLPYGLELYYNQYPNLEIKAIWPEPEVMPKDLLEKAKTVPVYYIIYQRNKVPSSAKLELIAKYRQGNGNDFFRLYKIVGPN